MAKHVRYHVRTVGTDEPVERIAETIEELAHSIRSHPSDLARVKQDADAIMHLAADIKLTAEMQTK